MDESVSTLQYGKKPIGPNPVGLEWIQPTVNPLSFGGTCPLCLRPKTQPALQK